MPDVVPGAQVDQNIALPWYDAGCSVVPIQDNGTKRPTMGWSILQNTRLTRAEVQNYWRTPGVGVAVICGRVSGGLEMTELEALATDEDSLYKIRRQCQLLGVADVWDDLTLRGYAEWTPSGGLHLLYRITDHEVPGNTKLASTETGRTLAETRGEGGYTIVAPSPGNCHPSGEPWTTVAGTVGVLRDLTWMTRCLIHQAITTALDESPPPPAPVIRRDSLLPTGNRPGDEFDQRTDWDEILTPQGWTYSHGQLGGEQFWVRPGKSVRDGHSASTGYADGKDRLYVWSTDAGLPTETPLSKFFVYAHYEHGGDMSAAARALVRQGFGEAAKVTPATELDEWTPSQVSLPLHTGYYDPTETGNGRRVKDQCGDSFHYLADSKRWLHWNGRIWEWERTQLVKRCAEAVSDQMIAAAKKAIADAGEDKTARKIADKDLAWARASQSERCLTNTVARFSAQPGVSVVPEDFDQDINLLNMGNGVFNPATGELLAHDPKYMQTMLFAADYRPEAQAPKFEQFMADVFPDVDTRAYMQRALGYTLLGKANERALFLLHGESGTGKSVLTDLMTRLFGGYGETAPAGTFRIKRNETSVDLHRLRGKRFVATSEMPEGAQLDEDLFKRVTGGDQVTSRTHYQEFETWKPRCVVWIATNYLPRVSTDDNAIWRRAKTIKMSTQFGGDSGRPEILSYADHLIVEADGIFNWLLEGLRQYMEVGLFEPEAVTMEVANYRVDTDSVASFIRDRVEEEVLVEGADEVIKSATVLTLYEAYCAEQRLQAVGGRRFANRMKAIGFLPVKLGAVQHWQGLKAGAEGSAGRWWTGP